MRNDLVHRALPLLLLVALWPLRTPSTTAERAPIRRPRAAPAYRNPLFRDVADPFVLKFRGEYYLYRTAVSDGLDVLTSRDLVHWRPGPTIWKPDRPENRDNLWAPEVTYENGTFYLYFAAGNSQGQQLWQATADNPLGPFHLVSGGARTPPWRIDPTLFVDDDGAKYLYCCRQRTEGGALVEGRRIESPLETIASGWQTMVRPERPWEGVWVEAPTVLRDPTTYYLLYSGPGAHLPTYEIGYATATNPLGPWQKRGILVPFRPGVPGPGHQGVVIAPDNLTPYLVYHRKRLAEIGWSRDLMLDRMAVLPSATPGGGRLATRAPTTTPQPLPPHASFEDHFDSAGSIRAWVLNSGAWHVEPSTHEFAQSSPLTRAAARLARRFGDAVIEVNFRRVAGDGGVGIALAGAAGSLPLIVFPGGSQAIQVGAGANPPLPELLEPRVFHQLLVTRRGASVAVRLDGRPVATTVFTVGPASLELITEGCGAVFSGVALTTYTRPLPLPPPEPPSASGWQRSGDQIEQRLLGGTRTYPLPEPLADLGDVSVQVRGWALGSTDPYPKYGLRLVGPNGSAEAYLDPGTNVLATHATLGKRELPWKNRPLPLRFDYTDWHTLRIARRGPGWSFTVDGGSAQQRDIGIRGPARVFLTTIDARAVFRETRVR